MSTRNAGDFLDQLDWDEESYFRPQEESVLRIPRFGGELRPSPVREHGVSPATEPTHEATPLLRKAVSFSATSHPRRASSPFPNLKFPTSVLHQQASLTRPNLPRRASTSSSQSGKHNFGGKSTFGQTVCVLYLVSRI